MPQYAYLFTLTPGAISGMIAAPSDRTAVVRSILAEHGGRLHAYYWMFGHWDGLTIAELPNSAMAAAVALAISSTGAFGRVETHELFESGEIGGLLETAGRMREGYRPPGAPSP